ncbi:MAG TPA: HAMP domain-containing sensor histidine kinase [Gaiellaceae bacterium]|nr:HAMP domain-containing sensor histidine kinase [Gaiellaceae bacterium]
MSVQLVLSGIYFLFPRYGNVQYAIFEVFAGLAILEIAYGVRRYRPVPWSPWLVFALGIAAFIAGDIFTDAQPNAVSPSPSDISYLVGYPLLAATVVMLVISSGSHRRTGALLDAMIVTFAFSTFQWIYVMFPAVHASGPLGGRIVLGILFPVMDIILLGAAAGFFVTPAWRTPAFALLVLGMGTQLLGDTAVSLSPDYTGSGWTDWPFMASYIFWGAAALHPSMRRLGEPTERTVGGVSRWRLAVLAAALLSVPVARVIADVQGRMIGVWVVAALSGAICLLVIARIAGILRSMDRARRLLAEQNEELVQADRLKDEFIALVSHDLRTPLTSIIGYVELALDDGSDAPLDEERRRYLEVVARSSDRLLRLVDDLLLAARLQSGRFALNVGEADLEKVAQEVLDEMHGRAERKGVSLFAACEGPTIVEGDRRRLMQLLDNLVSNAIKFTPQGGRVELRVERALDGAIVEVLDTGVGIEEGDEERIFDRFYRSSSSVTEHVQGTGLGLFIARAIAERHGGSLVARRRENGGSAFRLELPARVVLTYPETEEELVA